jgi:hypothetical protein
MKISARHCIVTLLAGTVLAQSPGRIAGVIDRIVTDDSGSHVRGWACQQGRAESIDVHIYVGDSATTEHLVYSGRADLDNEPAVDKVCQDSSGHRHRFDIPLPGPTLAKYHGMPLIIHGIRVAGNVENAAIAGSRKYNFPDVPIRQKPAEYPRLAGRYKPLDTHPRVFDSAADLVAIAQLANIEGSFTAGRFAALADRVRGDTAAKVDWQATYDGCDLEIYLRGFSYEYHPAYGNERTEDQLRAAMNGRPGLAPPHGSAIVAARAALYASLIKAGAPRRPQDPPPDAASGFAKGILLAWADHGFRDESGAFRRTAAKYCDLNPDGTPRVGRFGTFYGALNIARGVIYSVQAQDLLAGLHALAPDEESRLESFHRNLAETIRGIHNQEYDLNMTGNGRDETYNNQFVGHLTALLSIARLLDDQPGFDAALNGGSAARAVRLPWIELFDGVIYGEHDTPWIFITANSSPDPLKSHPAYNTAVAFPGEINDRYRHDNPAQTIGYPMGSLTGLYQAAELLCVAGFDPYGYHGPRGQSLEMATGYYACFAKSAGFNQTITRENSRGCQNVTQYLGVIVEGVGPNILIGALRYPEDTAITSVEADARKVMAPTPFILDPILFGKWRN